jgi:hypothetical protein
VPANPRAANISPARATISSRLAERGSSRRSERGPPGALLLVRVTATKPT